MIDILKHNRKAWDIQSKHSDSPWVQPVDAETIARARRGDWQVILTPTLNVPKPWFGDISIKKVLCLASGGGQQVPILAAAGAAVTSFDNSDEQLAKDRLVAAREGLSIEFIQGDMADLSVFEDASFDLIFHPISNVYVPDVRPVWQECHRVLNDGGRLLAGFMNPAFYLFDQEDLEGGGPLLVRYKLPYSDIDSLTSEQLEQRQRRGEGIEFSHSLDTQIGGQLEAGLMLAGFYEDQWEDNSWSPLNAYMPAFIATMAIKEISQSRGN